MDVQSVSKAQKASPFANVSANATPAAASGDNGSPENAFSSLLNLVGVKFNTFNTSSALGNMESKLMHSNDAAHALQTDARNDADQNAPRAVTKPKASKSDDTDSKAAKDDSSKTDDTAAATGAADAAAADQTQVAVQAAVAATVTLPVVAAVQAAPVVAAVQQDAIAEAVTGPVETVVQAAAVDTKAAATATAAVTAPEQITAAAPVVQQAAGPVVEQIKAADTGPKAAQTFAAATTTTDTATNVDTAAASVNTVTTAKAPTAKTDTAGPKETRSAAAVDQSQSMSRMLGDDNKAQIQVQVTGKAATTQAFGDTNPYNIYSGYTGAAESSTANGQFGDAAATNALVQTPKAVAENQAVVPPVVLPPQLQSQQAPAPAAATARVDATAPIQALESSGSTQNNSQNDAGFEAFGGHAQGPAATSETKATAQTATARPQVTPQEVVDQIKVVINRATKAGMDKVTIQLKPLELGRVDVKLEMSADHKVSVTVTADKPETLSLLKSDSHTLERTLNEAGLRTDSANLHFNLRSDSDAQQANQDGSGQGSKNSGADTADANTGADVLDTSEFDYGAAARTRGGVDTFA